MIAIKVVDASALGAVVFAEPEGEAVVDRLRDARLVAPDLLAYEIANVCLTKIRANPQQRTAFLSAFAYWRRLDIGLVAIEHDQALALAEATRLSVYDASYLWLARQFDGELVTLDRRLAQAAQARKRL